MPTQKKSRQHSKPNANQDNGGNSGITEPWSYTATIDQIEAIVNQIEAGQLELADVFEQFETAVRHLQACESFLSKKQEQLDLLIETLTKETE